MEQVFGIFLTAFVCVWICSAIHRFLRRRFALLYFLMYFAGVAVVVLWLAQYGAFTSISGQIMEPFILFLISPFFGKIISIIFGFLGIMSGEFMNLSGSVSDMLGLGSLYGYKQHQKTGEIKRNDPVLDTMKRVSEKAMYGKNYKNKDDDNYQ